MQESVDLMFFIYMCILINPKYIFLTAGYSNSCNMWYRVVFTLLISQYVIADIPGCDYFDTVDLTNSKRFANGSYQYEKLIIPVEQTGEYDYEILVDGEKEPVAKHIRGCACQLGTCVRFCCHKNLFLVEDQRKCSGDIGKAVDFDPYVSITLNDGNVVQRHIINEFIVQQHLPVPCAAHYHLDAANDNDQNWTLHENGTLLLNDENILLSKQQYCLQPHPIESGDNDTITTLVPHLCQVPQPSQWLTHTLRVLSIICLLITIFIYLWLPKLRNLHGYCLICYMICLIFAFALLLADAFNGTWTLLGCLVNGYVGYYAVMAGFLWLTVISYDLWNSFRGNNYIVQRYKHKNRVPIYSIYAWGVAAIMTLLIIIIDMFLDIQSAEWKPGVAMYNCWVKTHDWSAMLYFHGPMALQILFNSTLFTLTALRIIKIKRELQSVATPERREQKLKYDKQTFTLFVRLFVIMGVAWTFEIFSYLSQDIEWLDTFFSIFDYVNYAQGIIIFVLFVLKQSVLKLILNRIRGIDSTDDDNTFEEEIALQDRNGAAKHIGPNILN